jgi:hypothetical protein
MLNRIKCDKPGCEQEVPARFLFEASAIGADPRSIYEGNCPNHGPFQHEEVISRQATVVSLPPGPVTSVKCPADGCTRQVQLKLVTQSKEIGVGASNVRIYEGECADDGVFRARQSSP